jgi:hypothetical protein
VNRFALVTIAVAAASVAAAQTPAIHAEPFQLKIRHADPYMVKFMIEGRPIMQPEIGALMALGGMPNVGQAVNSLIKSGHLVVNPTDNSLWWFPDRA